MFFFLGYTGYVKVLANRIGESNSYFGTDVFEPEKKLNFKNIFFSFRQLLDKILYQALIKYTYLETAY
jgi:hypothetical protein